MTTGRAAAITNCLKRVLTALEPAVVVRYERKVMISVLLAITAFVPALGIAAIALFAIGNEQNDLALMYHQESILVQNVKGLIQAEDALMPLFILTGHREFLDELHQKEYEFDKVLAQLHTLEAPNSYTRQLLEEIAHLSQQRRALAGPGVDMRMRNEPIQNVNHYFEQNNAHNFTLKLHRSVDAFAQLTTVQFQNFVARQRQKLHNVSMMLLAAGGFAVVVSFGVSMLILRLLQAKKQHDAALAQEADWQRALADARKEAVETVAHDLRHPLQVMMFAAEKLQRVTTDKQSAQAALNNFTGSATAMRRLIDTVLNPDNIGAETLPVFKKPLDLHLMLHDVTSRFQLTAAAESIHLTYEPARDLPQVVADEVRLEQVVSNLLANAIKFTPAGGSVTLTAAWADPWITITVADTGRGMSQEQAGNVFSRYWRGGTAPEHGSGLGLAIIKAIIDAHDGRIEVNSSPGQGTVFVVFIPVISTTLQNSADQRAQPYSIAQKS